TDESQQAGIVQKLSDQALSHVIIEEDVIKNFFVNLAFENFEIATYHALLTLADLCGDRTAQQALKLSLNEEKSMATFVEEKIDPTIRTYIAKRKNEEQPLH
ncbi:ferritin-like domain-containing protein, partial [Komagataeibacter swingsii]